MKRSTFEIFRIFYIYVYKFIYAYVLFVIDNKIYVSLYTSSLKAIKPKVKVIMPMM